jgi:predicted phage terminase large subunit-like protein
VHLVLPNRYEPSRAFVSPVIEIATGHPWRDKRTEVDELLNPHILDQATTDAERDNDPATDEAQNQQNPTPPGGVIFRRDMFHRWSHSPTIDEWRKLPAVLDHEHGYYPSYPLPPWEQTEYLIITADLNNLSETQRAKKHTDYAVIDLWGKLAADRYLYRQIRGKLGVASSAHAIVELYRAYHRKTAVILIESKANGPTVIAAVRALLGIAHEEKLPRTHQIVRDWSVQGEDKRQRAEGIAHVPAAGRVIIPDERESLWVHEWLAEVCGFPNRTRDDRVDTMSMALSFLERGRQFG